MLVQLDLLNILSVALTYPADNAEGCRDDRGRCRAELRAGVRSSGAIGSYQALTHGCAGMGSGEHLVSVLRYAAWTADRARAGQPAAAAHRPRLAARLGL